MASKYNEALLGPIVAGSTTVAEVLRKLGLQPTGGNYRYINGCIRKLQLDTSHFHFGSIAARIRRLTREDLEPLVSRCTSFAQVLVLLGLPDAGRPYYDLTARIAALAIDTSHFRGRGWSRGETTQTHPSIEKGTRKRALPDSEVFVKNAPPSVSGRRLTKRLLKLGVRYECVVCGIDKWRGKRLSLHLDHLNGINNDNRIENLRLLCPNCHSQTDTYCRRPSRACEEPRVLYEVRSRAWRNWYPR